MGFEMMCSDLKKADESRHKVEHEFYARGYDLVTQNCYSDVYRVIIRSVARKRTEEELEEGVKMALGYILKGGK